MWKREQGEENGMDKQMLNLKSKLLKGEQTLGIWGTGYIGFSTMVNFAVNGVKCLGTDTNPAIVETINKGELPIPNMEFWLGFDPKSLVETGMISASTNWRELLEDDITVHMIAIPTEKGDKPWDGALEDVTKKIASHDSRKNAPLLVIVESTLTPNKTDELIIPTFESEGLKVGKDILVGVAPRRDWFISPEKSLKNLPRIVGGTTLETTTLIKEVLSIVCDRLLPAPDHRHAEMVKSIENAYRHVEITLANQLSLAYPDINMNDVLQLVGTKWNIGTYHPSFGTGGYCIPLASQYLLSGSERHEHLSILKAAVETDQRLPYLVADSLITRKAEKVGILGLSYKGDLKVHILSPTLKIVERLMKNKVAVKVNDPYYSRQELEKIVGVNSFQFPQGLKEFDTIVVTSGHRVYRSIPESTLIENLTNCRLILDNVEEVWRKFDFKQVGIEYYVTGDAGWLGIPL